ncbi:MAG TPA: DUF2251 domain-containing protein [Pyrinomonadaceae bacterium]|jgi:hypothetical protein|nr:DUF2251 domain-containing protein [Pyrinomonadaceae bacterium]
MPATIEAEETIRVGHETLVVSTSPITEYGVVFEDDGETGYFYGLDTSRNEGKQILDALHIYNVRSVIDKEKPSQVQIAWSEDGLKAALYINGYPHAVFDFAGKRGYCRSNFPSPNEEWTTFGKEWSDAVLESFH